MAVTAQALSPWPPTTMPAQRTAAIARLRREVEGRAGNTLSTNAENDEAACALGELAAARVEKEAPGAPQAVKDESVIRYAGYLAQADFGTITTETLGPRTVTYPTNHAAAWRYSGAYAVLAPWKVRRAGVIA